jgi:hypothetical protein
LCSVGYTIAKTGASRRKIIFSSFSLIKKMQNWQVSFAAATFLTWWLRSQADKFAGEMDDFDKNNLSSEV